MKRWALAISRGLLARLHARPTRVHCTCGRAGEIESAAAHGCSNGAFPRLITNRRMSRLQKEVLKGGLHKAQPELGWSRGKCVEKTNTSVDELHGSPRVMSSRFRLPGTHTPMDPHAPGPAVSGFGSVPGTGRNGRREISTLIRSECVH